MASPDVLDTMRDLPAIILFCFCCTCAYAQQPDSVNVDSLKLMAMVEQATAVDTSKQKKNIIGKVGTFFHQLAVKNYPSPRKALIIGFLIPGAGQAYNASFWKVPLVMGGMGTAAYNIDKNQGIYFALRDAYKQRLKGEEDSFIDFYTTTDQLRTIRDEAQKNYELSWIALVGVGILSAAEAFVDAHLKSFDVSDDLSFKPKMDFGQHFVFGNYVGIGVVVNFN